MNTRKETQHKLTRLLLTIYLVVLTWIILFKLQLNLDLLANTDLRSINLIPFAGSLIVNGRIQIDEIILNILVFVPFGVYLSMLEEDWNFTCKVAPIFSVSLAYEVFQYIFAVGASDITDLIGNTLGGILGIGLFSLLSRLLRERTIRILNLLALIGTVLVLIFFGILLVANY